MAYLIKDLCKYTNNRTSVNTTGPHSPGIGPGRGLNIGTTGGATLTRLALQRHNEVRPNAVKALIVYPMNALVEDQMTRLRQSLDSDNIRSFCNNELNGHRIFFGRYNSSSPVSGSLGKNKARWNYRG